MKHKRLFVGIALAVTLIWVVLLIPFRLRKTADRNDVTVELAKVDRMQIDKETKSFGEDETVKYAIRFTADKFIYAEHNGFARGEANCIGYAQYCAAVSNYISKREHLDLQAKPVVGQVYWLGINVCNFLQDAVPPKYKGFVKDHDFVEFTQSGEVIFEDPCMYDVMGRKCHTVVPLR